MELDYETFMRMQEKALANHTIGHCKVCGDPIVHGEEHYNFDGELVCQDCLYEYARAFKVVEYGS